MSKFDPPTPQALDPNELVQAIARLGADSEGVAKAVELIQIQEALKLQDQEDFANWVAQMVQDGTDKAIAALRRVGYDNQGVFQGDDLAPVDISESLPDSESRVNNRNVFLPTGLEGQYSKSSETSKSAITRMGRQLTDTEDALATPTADVASYFRPKSRFADELPSLFAGIGLSYVASVALMGNANPASLTSGFLVGGLLSIAFSRIGGGFPGIFALTTFGVMGARFFRGFIASAVLMATVAFLPHRLQNSATAEIPIVEFQSLVLLLIAVATAVGLLCSGKSLLWLRLTAGGAVVAAVAVHEVFTTSGVHFFALQFEPLSFSAALVLGLLVNAGLAYATTAGNLRFHLVLFGVSALVFTIPQLLVRVRVDGLLPTLPLLVLGFGVALTYATSSTTKSRFMSTFMGAMAGLASIFVLSQIGVMREHVLVLSSGLLASWLTAIAFDSIARKGRLHLASLNRSYGFYGSISWTSVLAISLSSLIAFSVTVFSPLSALVSPLLTVVPAAALLSGVFSLIRLPEIRTQEDEIQAALSRSHAATQVGIL